MDIIGHLSSKVWVPLKIGNLDISITNQIVVMWVAAVLVILFFYFSGRKTSVVPTPLQNFAEMYISALWQTIEPIVHDRIWLPFFCGLFSFILSCNLLGAIPGVTPPTANINFTATLAAMIFLIAQGVGIKKHGAVKYFSGMAPSGVPWPILIFLIPIEIMSQLARPFSLAVRLFANLFAGHAVILTIVGLIFVFKSYYVIPGSLIVDLAISMFEIFIAFIQAFIFTFLSAFYIGTSLEGEH